MLHPLLFIKGWDIKTFTAGNYFFWIPLVIIVTIGQFWARLPFYQVQFQSSMDTRLLQQFFPPQDLAIHLALLMADLCIRKTGRVKEGCSIKYRFSWKIY